MTSKRRREGTAVPQTRIGRLVSLGLAAGELAVGGAVEGLRRFASAQPAGAGSVFLTAASAERLAARLARLRGAAMKLGQLLSLEGEDLVPPEFARALATLRSGASPMPPAQLHRVLGREWGGGWARRFARFWGHGHTPGPMTVPREPPNRSFPFTLDLRYRPGAR